LPQLRRAARVAGVLLLACGALTGCHTGAKLESRPDYPTAKDLGASVDIQVIRNVTTISFTNTTAQSIPAGKIWVNSAFSREFPGLGVGESITLGLAEFQNRFGEAFRAGGFWSTQRPDSLVRVQIELQDQLVGLTVISVRPD
jgi:hypothetical protein